nr:MAG TPA: hypothetical protein [Caudoviricetes sp.]
MKCNFDDLIRQENPRLVDAVPAAKTIHQKEYQKRWHPILIRRILCGADMLGT